MRNRALLTTVLCLVATPAFAGEPCTDAKDLVKVAQSFYGNNPEFTNIITPTLELAIKGLNGAPAPTAILYRFEGEEEIVPVVDGELVGFEKVAKWSKDGEMCRMVDGKLAPETEGDSAEASMSFSFPYKRTDGVFSIDEIKEGAKDGSKVMSGLAPGGLGFVVPGLKGIALQSAEDSGEIPSFIFSRKDEPVLVKNSKLDQDIMFRLKDVKSSKADKLTIEGPYQLFAIFNFDPEDIAKAEEKRLTEVAQPED